MKFYSLILSIIAALGFTSCLGESDGTVIKQDFSPYIITYSTDLNTGETLTTNKAQYQLSVNPDKGLCKLTIQNLRLADGTYVNIEIPEQKYSFNQIGGMIVQLPSVVSNYNGSIHTITNYNFEYYSRYLNNQSFPMIISSFTIDATDEVRIIYNPSYFWGTTTVTDENGNTFVNNEQTSFYGIQFDNEKSEAMVAAFNMKFADKMPSLSMTFKNLPYHFNQYGYSASKDELTPYIGETPYPDYKITDFNVSGVWNGNMTVSFKCTIDTEKIKGSYDVQATLAIMPKINDSEK